MGKLKVTIEKGPDLFGAWADNVPGIYGEGGTADSKIVRRKGKLYVINKKNPKLKMRQG